MKVWKLHSVKCCFLSLSPRYFLSSLRKSGSRIKIWNKGSPNTWSGHKRTQIANRRWCSFFHFHGKLANCAQEIDQAMRLRYQIFVEEEKNLRLKLRYKQVLTDRYGIKPLETHRISGHAQIDLILLPMRKKCFESYPGNMCEMLYSRCTKFYSNLIG